MKKLILATAAVLLGIFTIQAQTNKIENSGFEEWEVPIGLPANHPEPVDWSSIKTSDNANINALAPVNWAQSDTAHSGNYSVRLFNVSMFGEVATGTLTNGRVHTPKSLSADEGYVYTDTTNPLWNTPLTLRPDSLTGWFLYKPVSGDHGNVTAILHTGYAQSPPADKDTSTWVGKASFDLPNTEVDTWTRFSVPFKYYSQANPQYILLILTSGNGAHAVAKSQAWFDDLKLIFHPTGIPNHPQGNLDVFVTNKELHLRLDNAPGGTYTLRVINILGRVQYTTTLQSGRDKTLLLSVPSGIYIVQARQGSNVLTKKVLIH
jgi:hypothetical protein